MPPEEKKTVSLRIIAGVILAAIVLTVAIFSLRKEEVVPQETGGDPVVEEVIPETMTEQEDVVSDVPTTPPDEVIMQEVDVEVIEPEPISDNVQEKINLVQERIISGEITLEEGQKEINKLLGI